MAGKGTIIIAIGGGGNAREDSGYYFLGTRAFAIPKRSVITTATNEKKRLPV